MKPNDLTGAVIDRFAYDTPDQAQADFYALCDSDKPLVMVFLPNFGHPISRVYLTRYMDTLSELVSGRLACVVRSEPNNIAAKLDSKYPFPLICDAGGVLYEYFGVQTTTSRMTWSFAALRIFREAKKQGYQMDKNTEQLLPLTLVVGCGGKILFSHYGTSLTDLPEDCSAMEHVCSKILEGRADAGDEEEEVQLKAQLIEEEEIPQQDAPDMDAFAHQVLFPGREVPENSTQELSVSEADADSMQRTQPIDLDGWLQQDNAEEPAEDFDEDSDEEPRWNKLVNLFAERDEQ